MDRSATYDFVLLIYNNHKSVSYSFRDKRRFGSKIATFPFPGVSVSHWGWRGVPLEMFNDGGLIKLRWCPKYSAEKCNTIVYPFRHNTISRSISLVPRHTYVCKLATHTRTWRHRSIFRTTTYLLTYLPTSGLLTSGLIIYLLPVYLFIYLLPVYLLPVTYLLIYLLVYLHLMAYGHTPLFPMSRNFVRATMPKPRGRSVAVHHTLCSAIVF